MSDKQTGGPAFGAHPESANWHPSWQGMTLRDYFAAKAMQALLARTTYHIEDDPDDISIMSYEYADSMLKARDGNS